MSDPITSKIDVYSQYLIPFSIFLMRRAWVEFLNHWGGLYFYGGMVCMPVLPVIAVVFILVGALALQKSSATPWLLSVPLCPAGSFPSTEFIGAALPESGVCPSAPANFAVHLPISLIPHLDLNQTMFLVHNLWNYDIDLALCSGSCENPSIRFAASRSDGVSSSDLRGWAD
jgi:hypothetical protein